MTIPPIPKASKDNSFKIRIPGYGTCWAIRLNDKLAVINNVILDDKVSFKAVVRYKTPTDDFPTVTKVVRQGWITESVHYPVGTQEETLETFRTISKYLHKHGVESEGMLPGMLTATYPRSLGAKKAKTIFDKLPIGTLLTEENCSSLLKALKA